MDRDEIKCVTLKIHIVQFSRYSVFFRLRLKNLEFHFVKHPLYQDFFGGGKRNRTADLLLARQALSQLSYTPIMKWWA